MSDMRGRFAPSPTGDLHLGNLRTALLAFVSARSQGGTFVVRMEDLDPVTSSPSNERRQLDQLASLGIGSDVAVIRQSERFELYREALHQLAARDLVYPCFCTRREIREAAAAPHGDPLPDGAYPGTCRRLSDEVRRRFEREGRPSAVRLRTDGERYTVVDQVVGSYEGLVDDVVLQRNDGVPAYNIAVVLDDHEQGITEVVRGDDLLASTPRQLHLQRLLGFDAPVYAHVPLVLGADGARLAKRHGAVTLADLADQGTSAADVLRLLMASIVDGGASGLGDLADLGDVITRFSWRQMPREPWRFRDRVL